MIKLLFIVFLLVGCVHVGHPINPDFANQIKFQSTTKAEIEALMGTPQSITSKQDESGTVEIWTYYHATASVFGAESDIIQIVFTPSGVVSDVIRTKPPKP